MKELINPQDRYHMNWIEGSTEWGTVKCVPSLQVAVKSETCGDVIKEEYIFTNRTDHDIFTRLTDIGIYTPFNDDYTSAGECMTNKCHTHIWCGGEVSYVMALRMGGEPPHLGLVLNRGSIEGYSVERDLKRASNDRGDFILHPAPFSLAPGESYTVAWTLFFHDGKEDFYRKAAQHCEKFLDVRADRYLLFGSEVSHMEVKANFPFTEQDVQIRLFDEEIAFTVKQHSVFFQSKPAACGELVYQISVGGVHTCLRLLVLPPLTDLAEARCRFITERQQYRKEGSRLNGAYLIYDNEDHALFYSPIYDYNGGRERIGMGLLIAVYLQIRYDADMEKSLLDYMEYLRRELVDEETGAVYQDYMQNDSLRRLYNAPWFALFYVELYRLYGQRGYLMTAYKIIMKYYENGGAAFYPIELPADELISLMRSEGMNEKAAKLTEQFLRHADHIAETGTDYPGLEVNYEQSIVAPAADILLKAYTLTKEKRYLHAAKRQIDVLSLFHGSQPDYHLYETAIRHWDGYWFGKRRLYGDTFPHYWSVLTAAVYADYARITHDPAYLKKADYAFRGVMSLFMPDGSASCAYLYPVTVNGERGRYYDPYANDQDRGLYEMLKHTFFRTKNAHLPG